MDDLYDVWNVRWAQLQNGCLSSDPLAIFFSFFCFQPRFSTSIFNFDFRLRFSYLFLCFVFFVTTFVRNCVFLRFVFFLSHLSFFSPILFSFALRSLWLLCDSTCRTCTRCSASGSSTSWRPAREISPCGSCGCSSLWGAWEAWSGPVSTASTRCCLIGEGGIPRKKEENETSETKRKKNENENQTDSTFQHCTNYSTRSSYCSGLSPQPWVAVGKDVNWPTHRPTDRPTDRPTNQVNNQPINTRQPTN